jgi:hypothetical protein
MFIFFRMIKSLITKQDLTPTHFNKIKAVQFTSVD